MKTTVLITGADGFVGQNLQLHLAERADVAVRRFTRANTLAELPALLQGVDWVFHLAGVNRPQDPTEFTTGNADLTQALCDALAARGRRVPVVYTSSTQAALDNPYGRSKRAAEDALFALQREHAVPVHVFRLPNVFGKWARPHYNSAVATFCHNTARGLPIQVNDPAAPLTLVHVDDVVARFLQLLDGADAASTPTPSLRGAEGDAAIQPGASAAAASAATAASTPTAAPPASAVTGSPRFARDDGNYPSLRGGEADAAIQPGASAAAASAAAASAATAASTPTAAPPASAALDRHASLATTTPPSLRGAEGDAAIQPGASAAAAAPITAAPSSGAVTGSPRFARDDGNYPSLRGAEGDAAIQSGAPTPTAASPASAALDRHGLRPRDDGVADGAGDDKPTFDTITPQYTTTVGEVARLIQAFAASRDNLLTERVGTGLVRALYATYVSYLPVESFAYPVPMHGDARGVFVEMLRTPDCGQFSFFTAHPGITRGGHYHHSKTEKFLVIQGTARFKFRHMQTGQAHELVTDGARAQIVETVPGWTHDITNIGTDPLVVMLWANEVFDRDKPDTFACAL